MGYFDSLETPVDEIAVGFGLPNGEYEVTITEINEIEKKENKGTAIVIKFTVDPGQTNAGKSHQQWVSVPNPAVHTTTDKMMTFASIMKQWFINIGIPESMLSEFDASNPEHCDAIIGNTGILKLRAQKNNPDFQNASFFLDQDAVKKEPAMASATPGVSAIDIPQATPDAEVPFDLSKF